MRISKTRITRKFFSEATTMFSTPPRRAKSALAGSMIAEKHIENDRMSEDLQAKINALQMKQLRLRADRDFQIKQAKEDAQVVFNQAKFVQAKNASDGDSVRPKGWRVIEPPKNRNTKNSKIIKERPVAAVFDPDDPRSYSSLVNEDGTPIPVIPMRKSSRPKTPRPRHPRPKTALATCIVLPTETAVEPTQETDHEHENEHNPKIDCLIEDAIVATVEANIPESHTSVAATELVEEPLHYSNFLGFIRPKTAESNTRPRGGFGDPNADYKPEKRKNTPHPHAVHPPPQNPSRPQTAAYPRRPRTACPAPRSQSRADEGQGLQSYKDLKSQNHIDFASVAITKRKRSDSIKKRKDMEASESAVLQERMKAFYVSIEDFKVKAARMKKHQIF
ncbi:uncharacterized protein LOC135488242 [Lineus longissimus]|uniref:uncharacterized protein LOC135488242 n=1 Tax=Lineus longissimus TaxID=88925 RepID=UPI00315DD739